MTDKPEIVAIIVDEQEQWVEWDTGLYCGAELIRLTDHEAARAADKTRIAELEVAESELKTQLSEALMAIKTLCPECKKKWLYRHCGDAALAQQGKEGGV